MSRDIPSELRKLGLKLTPQRSQILSALKDMGKEHPSLNELHGKIIDRMPSVSFSTLYNTITTLEKMGYLRLFDLGGETRVEMNPKDHINIIDPVKGTITDIDDVRTVNKVLKDLDRTDIRDRRVLINVIIYDLPDQDSPSGR
jgi:Fe2+ or Zn2+ uptake regulation protein